MPIQATDVALFLVSFAACIYCIVLSRRLRVLQNTKNGLGATIMALSDSIATMSAATQETRLHASDLATRLTDLMQDAQKASLKIDSMTRDMEARHSAKVAELTASSEMLRDQMDSLISESEDRIAELRLLNEQVRLLADAKTETILEAIHRAAAHVADTKPKQVHRYES
jgi:uncharacterized protein YoxC